MVHAEIRDRLRSLGLRSTMPRVAVVQQLLEATTPKSHADIVEALSGQGIDRATIYRNLADLTNSNRRSRSS